MDENDEKYGGTYPYRAVKNEETEEDVTLIEDVYDGPSYFGEEEGPDEDGAGPADSVSEVHTGPAPQRRIRSTRSGRPPIAPVYAGPDILGRIDRVLPRPEAGGDSGEDITPKILCPLCGSPQDISHIYCNQCGTRLREEEPSDE